MYENKRKPSPKNCRINYVVLSGRAFLFYWKITFAAAAPKEYNRKVIPFKHMWLNIVFIEGSLIYVNNKQKYVHI